MFYIATTTTTTGDTAETRHSYTKTLVTLRVNIRWKSDGRT